MAPNKHITRASSGIWTMWALAEAIGLAILQLKPRYPEKFTSIARFLAVFLAQLLLFLAPLFAYIPNPLKRKAVIRRISFCVLFQKVIFSVNINLNYTFMSKFSRRDFILTTGAAAASFTFAPIKSLSNKKMNTEKKMYGLISKINAKTGKREELIAILLEGTEHMPGCLSYVIAKDSHDKNAIWVTEIWDSKESHEDSLSLPSVQEAMSKGKPLIAGFGERFETLPIGGHGLVTTETQ